MPRTFLSLSCCVLLAVCGVVKTGERAVNSFSNSKRTLRVMTYNIQHGAGTDQKLNLPRIAEVINRVHPDLVGLQEVDRGVERTERVDEISELARRTSMEYAFAYNLHYQGGQYGVAVLSRFPILSVDHRRYDNRREARRRGFIRAEVSVAGRRISFVTTHLDYQYEDGRVFETEQLMKALDEVKEPLIVVGDFNDLPTESAYKLMRTRFDEAWEINGSDSGLSYPADKPKKRIDYIFYTKADGVKVKRAWVVDTLASDHRPVVADLEIKSGEN
ncbi:MAG TPA: endonuclease/exonuclease/phosphatase family protein [Pyrinomonadaceae bacterium]|nr:endonuclease/exonuclease/phosphatase family protein [Pyrinomonadaceae bacterium]